MVEITLEVNGKLYKLERYYGDCPCESCDLADGCCEDAEWCGLGVCDSLPGIWKEKK